MRSKNRAALKTAQVKQWRLKIQEWKQSGLSQARFSELHGIKPCTFSYWKCRLQNNSEVTSKNESCFLPLSVIQEDPVPLNTGKSGLSVTIQNRFTINIDEQFNSSTFFQLVQVLEEL
ncbi:MAG: hypothetical protein GY786_11400 [Proteobacteria bacterium]|nr:hypothetical protein [Pseudomonadota bacterium]